MSVMEGRTTSALLYLDGVHVSFDGFHAINIPGYFHAIPTLNSRWGNAKLNFDLGCGCAGDG